MSMKAFRRLFARAPDSAQYAMPNVEDIRQPYYPTAASVYPTAASVYLTPAQLSAQIGPSDYQHAQRVSSGLHSLFAVRPIVNGFLLQQGGQEWFLPDIVSVGAKVTTLLAVQELKK